MWMCALYAQQPSVLPLPKFHSLVNIKFWFLSWSLKKILGCVFGFGVSAQVMGLILEKFGGSELPYRSLWNNWNKYSTNIVISHISLSTGAT
jgi:hypothetical protein